MLKSSLLLIALLGSVARSSLWESYKVKFAKSYTPEEDEFRQRIFSANLKTIAGHNARADLGLETYRLGVNKFVDRTEEELNASLGNLFVNSGDSGQVWDTSVEVSSLPATVDWRQRGVVSPCINQSAVPGVSSYIAVTGAVESQRALKRGSLEVLSTQQVIECNGVERPSVTQVYDYIFRQGLETSASYPYSRNLNKCKYDPNKVVTAVSGWDTFPASESTLQDNIAQKGPIVVQIDITTKLWWYTGGIFSDNTCVTDAPNQVLLAVGYGSENGVDYWTLKNSWGPEWAENGYMRIRRNAGNMCGIASNTSLPILA